MRRQLIAVMTVLTCMQSFANTRIHPPPGDKRPLPIEITDFSFFDIQARGPAETDVTEKFSCTMNSQGMATESGTNCDGSQVSVTVTATCTASGSDCQTALANAYHCAVHRASQQAMAMLMFDCGG